MHLLKLRLRPSQAMKMSSVVGASDSSWQYRTKAELSAVEVYALQKQGTLFFES